jgi:tetratricopeptide (TPR) repeat protein
MIPTNKAQDDDLVMSLVDLALAQLPDRREAYLRSACARDGQPFDHELFAEAWRYVQWERRMGGFLLDPLYSLTFAEVAFQPGEFLDDRFRIVRQVGEGGMGLVYEAQDEKLERRVALKFAKAGFRKRLPPEVRHAREISHPNVCKIFDIHTATTDRGEIDFLTMEFLEGDTLSDRLRAGPLPEREAHALARQLASGLAGAHANQVIHGDLKSSNIILTNAADGSPRAVITDFGLARGSEAALASAASAVDGGTPDYMAPELWRGQKATVASDIYALGVIFYEMLSGGPFHSPNISWEERLAPKPPRILPKWDPILARCLDPNPARRYQSADQIATALAPRSRRWLVATAAGLVLVVVAGAGSYQIVTRPKESVRLAMLPFETPANRALTDGLLKEAAGRLRQVKSSNKLGFVLVGQNGGSPKKIDTPDKAAKLLKATHVLTGTLRWNGGRALLQTALSDATSLQLKQWQAEFEPNEVRYIPTALAGVVTGALHLPPLNSEVAPNPAAAADFSTGVAMARRDDRLDAAVPLLERAVAADPDSPLTHARLAEALLLKYRVTRDSHLLDRARLSLESAEKRNPDLALVWLVSGILGEYTRSYTAAESNLQRARELEPGNADIWRHLGGVYAGANRLSEAEVAYKKAIELDPGYFKNYQELCSFYGNHGTYDQAVRECRQSIALGTDLASVHYTLTRVYLLWGRYPEAEQEARTTLTLDPMSPRALTALALALGDQGHYSEAIPFFERMVQIDPETDLGWVNLGTGYRLANQPRKAKKAYEKGADLARAQLGSNFNDGTVRSHLAYLYAWLGDRREAEYEAGQSLQLAGGSVDAAFFVVLTYEALNERERSLDLASRAPPELLRYLKYDAQPDLAGLHKDSRFQQLIELHNIQ